MLHVFHKIEKFQTKQIHTKHKFQISQPICSNIQLVNWYVQKCWKFLRYVQSSQSIIDPNIQFPNQADTYEAQVWIENFLSFLVCSYALYKLACNPCLCTRTLNNDDKKE